LSERNELDQLFDRVAGCLLEMDLERDFWQKAGGLTALIKSGEERYVEAARAILERSVATQTSEGNLNFNDVERHVAGHIREETCVVECATLGYPLLLLHERSPRDEYLDAARLQVGAVDRAPRTRDGGVTQLMERIELWIDYAYLLCPFLVKYGLVASETRVTDEGFNQLFVHLDHLWEPRESLARHAWVETPNHFAQSTFWARGNGWLAAGLADMLGDAPGHDGAERARETLQALLARLVTLQDRSGYWRNVLDDPRESLETSGTLMFGYAIARAVELGVVDEKMVSHAVRAFRVVTGGVRADGAVKGVALPPGGQMVPLGVTPIGQGWLLLLMQVLRRIDAI
jgi:unsaturated rhamnogalacturonyl hydrolase